MMSAGSSPMPCTASGIPAQPLAELVHEKTGGNPFFAIQFLTALAEEGLLRLDPDAAAWIWDLARIRAKGYTDNVVDLMVGKLKRLSGATQTALQQLACLGNVVEIRHPDSGLRGIRRGDPHVAPGGRPYRADRPLCEALLRVPPRPYSGGGLCAHP